MLPVGATYSTAHAPIGVYLSYDADTKDLTANIYHTVGDPNVHFIYSISVTINSVLNETYTYESQPDANEFDYVYHLNLVEGDIVSVTAICNQGGETTGTLTYTLSSDDEPTDDDTDDAPTDDGDDKSSTPGYTIYAAIGSLFSLGIIYIHKTRSRRL
ncbi:MAG: hypothetical protein ACTSYU_02250 [Promethearchaeota archaeon]